MTPDRRLDESMAILTDLYKKPVEPGYEAQAARRKRAGLDAAGSTRTLLTFVACAALGFLVVVAAISLRPAPIDGSRAKAALVARIEAQRARVDTNARAVASLGASVATLQRQGLDASGADALAQNLTAVEQAGGAVPLHGPGVLLTLDDAANISADSGLDPRNANGFPNGRITSSDLQIVTNGLWAAGAEAVSINGQRLTSRSSIRYAGQAILVDYRPLVPPYLVTALGDPRALAETYSASAAATYVTQLTTAYQIRASLTTADDLTVPAASVPDLRNAVPATPPEPTP